MSGRNALATPTNVYPRNGNVVTLDPVNNNDSDDRFVLSFTNQSDSLSYYQIKIYDSTTNKLVRDYVWKTLLDEDEINDPYSDSIYRYHRGDTIRVDIRRDAFDNPDLRLYSGYHYNYKLIMFSSVHDPTGTYLSTPNCVVPYASGKVLKIGDADTGLVSNFDEMTIQDGILNINPPSFWDSEEPGSGIIHHHEIIGCTYIRIGHEERMVDTYDPETGILTVTSPFNVSVDFNEGIQYFLYCNYIETTGSESEGSYDFYIREKIESSFNGYPSPLGLQCKTTYFQANNVGLENYRFKVYTREGNNCINGSIQSTTSETEGLVDARHFLIGTGLERNIIGKDIRVAKSDSATFEDNIVTEGWLGTIRDYNPTTGVAFIQIIINGIPKPGTLYTIWLDDKELIADSGDVYSWHQCYNLPVYPYGQTFDIDTILTSYEKQQSCDSKRLFIPVPSNDPLIKSHTINVDNINQRVSFTLISQGRPEHESSTFNTTRRNVYRRIMGTSSWKWIGYIPLATTFIDYLVGNNRIYEYLICERYNNDNYSQYDPSVNYKPYKIENVVTEWDGWTITSIKPYDPDFVRDSIHEIKTDSYVSTPQYIYAKEPYIAGDTWRFISNIDSGSIVSNLDRTVHVGTSKMPTVTSTNNNYQSGIFSMNLLTLLCPDETIVDDIEKVEAWLKFINDDSLYILKSDKGDVWIIAISDNTSRSYDESVNPILTSASYSWTEVKSVDEIQIIQ